MPTLVIEDIGEDQDYVVECAPFSAPDNWVPVTPIKRGDGAPVRWPMDGEGLYRVRTWFRE